VLAGIQDRWSFSLGGYTYETDGFRPNNDLDVTTGNLLIQYQLSPDTSFFAEVRSSSQDRGELRLRFDPDAFDSSLPRENEDTTSWRLGFRHDFSPRSTVMALLAQESRDFDFTLTVPPLDSNLDTTAWSGEFQYIYRADVWSVVSGLRYYQSKVEDTFDFMGNVSVNTTRPESFSAYVYGTAEVWPQLQLTLGLSRDENRQNTYPRSRWNPKAGLIWQVTADTTVRAGAFQTMQSPKATRQDILPSLEPTAVAGFNQFFYGSQSEEADRYGLGIDHRFPGGLNGGVELSRRRLDVPYMTFMVLPPEERTAGVREDSARTYLYWSATERLAASLAYTYDQARNDANYTPNFVQNVETHQVALQLGYFDPRGPLAVLRPVYGHQRGRFQDTSAPPFPFVADRDDFTVVDALLGYRLPKRWGLISIEVRNLFDSEFNFQDIDPDNPRIYPERVVLLKATLAY
jgi:outer membrane receptor for ferrienterochelin and colicin